MGWINDIKRVKEDNPCASCSNCSRRDDCENKKYWSVCGAWSYDM